MNRTFFRQTILPLTDIELYLKDIQERGEQLHVSTLSHHRRDENGNLLLSKEEMLQGLGLDQLHNPLTMAALNHQMRLIIHNRFSTVPFQIDSFIGINYVYSGCIHFKFGDGSCVDMTEGQICMINTGIPFSFSIQGENDLIFGIQIDKDFLTKDLLYGLSGTSTVFQFLLNTMLGRDSDFKYLIADTSKDERMRNLMEDLFCEYLDPSIYSEKLVKNYLQTFLIYLLQNDLSSSSEQYRRFDIIQIIRYIEEHCTECTLETLAETFHFTAKYLSALIKKETNRSFSEILSEARIRNAKYYLENTSLPIAEIANECGYSNMNFFYTKFKSITNLTPKEYREQQRSRNLS